MTLLNGFLPSAPFKCRDGMDFDCLPTRAPHKQRQHEVSNKPVESYTYFVAIVLNEDGSLQMRSSGQMRRYERHILEEAYDKFKEVMENYIENPEVKRHRPVSHSPLSVVRREMPPPPYAPTATKRRYPGSLECVDQPRVLNSQRKEPARQAPRGDVLVTIGIDAKEAQAKWFSDAFKAVQQVACRTIAKVWIKKIHPKKQSTHPYNGLYPRHSQADPSRTRPPYWPLHVIHKEPDHIDRNARTALLVHLIMNTPQPQIRNPQDPKVLITARDLMAALEEKKVEFKGDRWKIIGEIIRVREQIEMFAEGGYGPETVIYAPDYSESPRCSKSGTEADSDDLDASIAESVSTKIEEEEDDDTATPPSTRVSSPSSDRPCGHPQTCGLEQNSLGALEEEHDSKTMDHNNEDFQSSSNDFDGVPSEQDSIGMTVDPRPFVRDSNPDPSQLRLQKYLGQESDAFRTQLTSRQGHDLMLQSWLPSQSSNNFGPTDFALDNNQILTTHGFHVDELGLMHGNRQTVGMHTAHGLPTAAGMTYQDYTTTAPRPLPHRAMSTPHGSVMDQLGAHDLGLVHQPYFDD